MPELPEVETIRRSLEINVGARIADTELIRADMIRSSEFKLEDTHGLELAEFKRRGKYLILKLQNSYHIVVHLGMSGRFYMMDAEEELTARHIHLIIILSNGRKLIFQDPRRFGGIWLVKDIRSFFSQLGREPLKRDFNAHYLHGIVMNRRVAIKTLILNQNLISGVGNIYADEALYRAHIRPDRAAGSLSKTETLHLSQAIKKVLEDGINSRGTTFRDYRDGNNQNGAFQDHLKVYGKMGQMCPQCGTIIKRERIGGRSSHYCPSCQK